jgi:zinc transport system substrate-binding protein
MAAFATLARLLLALPACFLALAFPPSGAHAKEPNVVVTIKPVHALAAAILDGVAKPRLLLEGASSPHSYAMRPSDAEALSKADAIVRVSENLEVFLERAIKTLPKTARIIDLEEAPGLSLLAVRENLPGGSEAAEIASVESGHHHGGNHDVHFWLDPENAMKLADYLAAEFGAIDPEHAAQFKANAESLKVKLAALNDELKRDVADVSNKPFVTFHDVTQYFEKRYGLKSVGAITVSPERAPGAKRLAAIRAKIKEGGAICVFSEPQFPPKLVSTLIEGTSAKQGVLDEIGADLPAGPDQYFALMRKNSQSLAACLRS